MTDVPQSDSSVHGDRPGKMRTMWHPLLVRMLDYALGPAFTVREEVSVGKMPLRVDILLIRREGGQLSEAKRRDLSALVPLLNRYTLIEFKGPTDVMERGDFAQLVGCAFLWHSQEREPIPQEAVSLVVICPMISEPLRDELQLFGFEASQHEPGIFRVAGLPFATWLVETDVMAESGQAVLSLVSRAFLNDRGRIIEKLGRAGHERLVGYATQQIHQFRGRKDFAVQYADSEKLEELEEDMLAKILEWVPAERRVRGLSPQELAAALSDEEDFFAKILEWVPAERRVRGLSLEERLAGLSEEEAARLREVLERKHTR